MFGKHVLFSSAKERKQKVVSVSRRLDHVVHCHTFIEIIVINFM